MPANDRVEESAEAPAAGEGQAGPFLHGVASGDPLADRVIIWTRVSGLGAPAEVAWTLAHDPGLADVVASGTETTDEASDFTVKVDVAGLSPASTYYYAFDALGARSPVGRTRTAPEGSCERLRLGVASCAQYTAGYFNAYGRLAAREDLDFVLHLGDYIYEYGNDEERAPASDIDRVVEPRHAAVTLSDYRRRYAHYRRDEDLQALHRQHPIIATIDDHEIADDTWREGAGKHDAEEHGDWPTRKSAALRAWREWLPVRPPDPHDPERIHRALPFGDLAHLVVLDARTRRDPQTEGPERENPDRTMLGGEQFRWLLDELDGAQATWRLVANSVMFGQVYTDDLPEDLGGPLEELSMVEDHGDGPVPEPDPWDAYPAERNRLFDAIQNHGIENVVFLSGDVHSAWAVELRPHPEEPDAAPLAVEFVTASVTTPNLDDKTGMSESELGAVERRVTETLSHVRWADLTRHGYIVLDLSPERAQAEWHFVDDLRRRSEGEQLGDSWLVRAGEPGLVHAEAAAG